MGGYSEIGGCGEENEGWEFHGDGDDEGNCRLDFEDEAEYWSCRVAVEDSGERTYYLCRTKPLTSSCDWPVTCVRPKITLFYHSVL